MPLPPDGPHPTTARDAFGRRPYDRYVPIPEGHAGNLATLAYLADLIRQDDPAVDTFVMVCSVNAATDGETDTETARWIFNWAQAHIRYTPDVSTREIVDEVRTPAYLLHEITRTGHAEEDCDGFVAFLGAVYYHLGWPVTLIAVSTRPDAVLDHVFLTVTVDGETYTADAIVNQPFGWEIPHAEQTARVEWPVAA
jgi:hypothetical protein